MLHELTTEKAKEIFESIFGETKQDFGFSLSFKKTKSGIVVSKWYARNSWVDDKLEKQVLLSNGKVYENKKEIATY